MNDLVIFCGPTISRAEGRLILPEADFRDPVRRGDVYRVLPHRPWAIAIIDGVFDQSMSVWHKEILWALNRGVRVYGASSMGALRAAELAHFGMIGVGKIFEAYQTGALEDDDEVAISHGTAEAQSTRFGEAMVNIRATIDRAVGENVLDGPTAQLLVGAAKSLFYPDRVFKTIIACARVAGALDPALRTFQGWLALDPPRTVDQKKLDAKALLERLRDDRKANPPPARRTFQFQYTEAWKAFRDELDSPADGATLATA